MWDRLTEGGVVEPREVLGKRKIVSTDYGILQIFIR